MTQAVVSMPVRQNGAKKSNQKSAMLITAFNVASNLPQPLGYDEFLQQLQTKPATLRNPLAPTFPVRNAPAFPMRTGFSRRPTTLANPLGDVNQVYRKSEAAVIRKAFKVLSETREPEKTAQLRITSTVVKNLGNVMQAAAASLKKLKSSTGALSNYRVTADVGEEIARIIMKVRAANLATSFGALSRAPHYSWVADQELWSTQLGEFIAKVPRELAAEQSYQLNTSVTMPIFKDPHFINRRAQLQNILQENAKRWVADQKLAAQYSYDSTTKSKNFKDAAEVSNAIRKARNQITNHQIRKKTVLKWANDILANKATHERNLDQVVLADALLQAHIQALSLENEHLADAVNAAGINMKVAQSVLQKLATDIEQTAKSQDNATHVLVRRHTALVTGDGTPNEFDKMPYAIEAYLRQVDQTTDQAKKLENSPEAWVSLPSTKFMELARAKKIGLKNVVSRVFNTDIPESEESLKRYVPKKATDAQFLKATWDNTVAMKHQERQEMIDEDDDQSTEISTALTA